MNLECNGLIYFHTVLRLDYGEESRQVEPCLHVVQQGGGVGERCFIR